MSVKYIKQKINLTMTLRKILPRPKKLVGTSTLQNATIAILLKDNQKLKNVVIYAKNS